MEEFEYTSTTRHGSLNYEKLKEIFMELNVVSFCIINFNWIIGMKKGIFCVCVRAKVRFCFISENCFMSCKSVRFHQIKKIIFSLLPTHADISIYFCVKMNRIFDWGFWALIYAREWKLPLVITVWYQNQLRDRMIGIIEVTNRKVIKQ